MMTDMEASVYQSMCPDRIIILFDALICGQPVIGVQWYLSYQPSILAGLRVIHNHIPAKWMAGMRIEELGIPQTGQPGRYESYPCTTVFLTFFVVEMRFYTPNLVNTLTMSLVTSLNNPINVKISKFSVF